MVEGEMQSTCISILLGTPLKNMGGHSLQFHTFIKSWILFGSQGTAQDLYTYNFLDMLSVPRRARLCHCMPIALNKCNNPFPQGGSGLLGKLKCPHWGSL